MLTRPEQPLPNVSFHAIERYIQRVMGVTLRFKPEELPGSTPHCNAFRAHRHCEAAGLTMDQVIALILTPTVVMACRGGYSSMPTREFIAVIQRGQVVTIKTKHRAPQKKIGRSIDYRERRRSF